MQGHSSIFIFGIDISPLLNQNLTILNWTAAAAIDSGVVPKKVAF